MVMIMMTTISPYEDLDPTPQYLYDDYGMVNLRYLQQKNEIAWNSLDSKRESHGTPVTTETIGRLASFISLRDIKIRVDDSSGLSSDVSLSPVCAH